MAFSSGLDSCSSSNVHSSVTVSSSSSPGSGSAAAGSFARDSRSFRFFALRSRMSTSATSSTAASGGGFRAPRLAARSRSFSSSVDTFVALLADSPFAACDSPQRPEALGSSSSKVAAPIAKSSSSLLSCAVSSSSSPSV